MTDEELTGAVARGWCSPENSHKEMDATLVAAIVTELRAALAAQPAAVPLSDERISIEDEILRLRGIVPEILEKINDDLCEENARLGAELDRLRPLTGAQLDRLYANSPEYHKDAKSAKAFKRIVQLTEQAHGISAGGAA